MVKQALCRKFCEVFQWFGGANAAGAAEYAGQKAPGDYVGENERPHPRGWVGPGAYGRAADLGGGGTPRTPPLRSTISRTQPKHKRAVGRSAMQICNRPKKRGSNRSWSLNAQGRSQIAKYGPNAREEDLRQTGWALTEGGGYGQNPVPSVAGPREEERSGVASTRSNIDFDRLVSNAFSDMPAMQ